MKKMIVEGLLLGAAALFVTACTKDGLTSSDSGGSTSTLTSVAQTSGQLASGTSFRISGAGSGSSAALSVGSNQGPAGNGGPDHGGHFGGPLDGTYLLAPTNELLAIIEAESAGDIRGIEMHVRGGATLTNYNQAGDTVTIPRTNGQGPAGCSFSGGQFPKYDSLLGTITKTIIDFGNGITERHDTVSITRSGKIIINRSGDRANRTEVITFDNYTVNGNLIEGTKTRVSTFLSLNGVDTGSSTTNVAGGKITFSDGTIATWTSDKQRKSSITLDSTAHKPISGEITTEGSVVVKASDGTIIYSHTITKTLTENVACDREHHGPVSGSIETIYRTNTISIDFGDGSCNNNTITITVNGVTTTHTVQG